jgi:glycosyltransferase involved in cell wall biosynthesis
MKLIIQIPCYNEEHTLPATLRDLPVSIGGIDVIETLVVDDGSSDGTVEAARALGVNHVARLGVNRGLAFAFKEGLRVALDRGADIIVNTDADNQYNAADIPMLIAPILSGDAEIVIGERPISDSPHFSPLKKLLQKVGSWVVRKISNTTVQDAPSGFRAFSRSAAQQLNVFNEYTYTLETIIQAGHKGLAVVSVPIRVNPVTRESRLVSSLGNYVKKSMLTMFRFFVVYRPLRFFVPLAIVLAASGFLISLRFLIFFLMGDGGGHVQSLILSVFLMGSGLLMFSLGLLADLISVNRKLMEELQARLAIIEDRMNK